VEDIKTLTVTFTNHRTWRLCRTQRLQFNVAWCGWKCLLNPHQFQSNSY